MKLYKYLFLALVTTLGFAACTKDDGYAMVEPSAVTSSVFIPAKQTTNYVLGLNDPVKASFKVCREDKKGERTVKITPTMIIVEGLVQSYTTEAHFADGDSIATIEVTLNPEKMELMKQYDVFFAVDPAEVYPYKANDHYPQIKLSFTREDFAPFAEGTLNETFLEKESTKTLEYSPKLKIYRIADFWGTNPNSKVTFTIDAKNNITMGDKAYATGYTHAKYGAVSADATAAAADEKEADHVFNPKQNTYFFNFRYYVNAGSFGFASATFTVTKQIGTLEAK